MRVHNKSKRMYQHGEYNLPAGGNIEVPEEIAKIWLATGHVVEFVKPEEAKAKEEKLEAENAKLKAEIEKLKTAAKKTEEAKAKEEKTNTKSNK